MVIKIITTEVPCKKPGGVESIIFSHPERFQNLEYIGGGSFGHVVSAEDTLKDRRKLAIKLIPVPPLGTKRSQAGIKQLLREMIILRDSQNPQIVEFVTVYMNLNKEKEPIGVNIVMTHCGKNLVDFICDRGLIEPRQLYEDAATIVYNIARGINFLQALDIYHRDLKPSNICIDLTDRQFPAKIIDLGMARIKPQESFQLTRRIATVCYRAPEMLLGLKYYDKLDIWSLGCIFAYLIVTENIFWYTGKGLNETSGTIQKIFELLGKPSVAFIDQLNEVRDKVDRRAFEHLKKCSTAESAPATDAFETLFPSNPDNVEQRDEAIELIRGILQWNGHDRWTISKVLESSFLKNVRHKPSEELPPPDLCKTIKDSIKKYEDMVPVDGKSADQTRDILFNVIAEKFGYDPEVGDSYSYANHRSSQSKRFIKTLQTWTVIGMVVSVPLLLCDNRYHPAQVILGALTTGSTIIASLSILNNYLHRHT